MPAEVIEYHSAHCTVNSTESELETKSHNGITCTWSGQVVDGVESIKFTWKFNWDKLKEKLIEEGVDGLHGHIITRRTFLIEAENVRINVELTAGCQIVEKTIPNAKQYPQPSVAFDYFLTPIHQTKISYDDLFAGSDKTDGILVVEGKKLHVNRAFLSFHSDFFTALFSSNFKEGHLTEVPIEDVSYEDFGLLMSTIYPNTVFPNDRTAEKLLELADRFLMPSVTAHVEYHLLRDSKLPNEKIMWMADAYQMKKVLEKSLRSLDTVAKIKELEKSESYKKLSDGVKVKVFEKLIKMV